MRSTEALEGVDVLIDYTSHDAVLDHTLTAIRNGVAVVVGSSGLGADDFAEIEAAALEHEVGVIAAGNFSAHGRAGPGGRAPGRKAPAELGDRRLRLGAKPDAPSGTARELAERLSEVRAPEVEVPIPETAGHVEARGATVAGSQVHSVRLPGFSVSTEIVFGLPDERLTIRHDAGSSAAPYVAGTLLAARAVIGRSGLTRGLDTLLLG